MPHKTTGTSSSFIFGKLTKRLVTSRKRHTVRAKQCRERRTARLKSSAGLTESQNHANRMTRAQLTKTQSIIILTELRASMLGRMDGQGWTEAQKNRQRTRTMTGEHNTHQTRQDMRTGVILETNQRASMSCTVQDCKHHANRMNRPTTSRLCAPSICAHTLVCATYHVCAS